METEGRLYFPQHQAASCVLIIFCEWITTIFKDEQAFRKQGQPGGLHGLGKVLEMKLAWHNFGGTAVRPQLFLHKSLGGEVDQGGPSVSWFGAVRRLSLPSHLPEP